MSVREALYYPQHATSGIDIPLEEEFSIKLDKEEELLTEGISLLERSGALEVLEELHEIVLEEDYGAQLIEPRVSGENAVYAEVRWGIQPTQNPGEIRFNSVPVVVRPTKNNAIEIWSGKSIKVLQEAEWHKNKLMLEIVAAHARITPSIGTEKGTVRKVLLNHES